MMGPSRQSQKLFSGLVGSEQQSNKNNQNRVLLAVMFLCSMISSVSAFNIHHRYNSNLQKRTYISTFNSRSAGEIQKYMSTIINDDWDTLTQKVLSSKELATFSIPVPSFDVKTTIIDPIVQKLPKQDFVTLRLPLFQDWIKQVPDPTNVLTIPKMPTVPDLYNMFDTQDLLQNMYDVLDFQNSFLSESYFRNKIASFLSNGLDTEVPLLDMDTIQNYYIDTLWKQDWLAVVTAISQNIYALYVTLPLWIEVLIVAIPTVLSTIAILTALSFPDDDYRVNMEPYARGEYDANQARSYYSRHPIVVLQRLLQMLRLSNQFILNILVDKYIFRNEESQRGQRAEELLELITKLGPTAIKVGQALSVRPDLIPEEYARSLSTLQDQVPPFDGKVAQMILKSELGQLSYNEIKVKNYAKPIASASIGQVYKGTIQRSIQTQDGSNRMYGPNDEMETVEVAIKVQRPNVLAEIALDLFIVREIVAPIYRKVTRGATDLKLLASEWGRGFIAELDYRREAESTKRFNDEMIKRNLNAVIAPKVVDTYSTERILVTEWVDGTRLDQSTNGDVSLLCSVALNAYLVMLLELKSLHCDPHPGNLLRTTDGRLCILDFGMTLDIDPGLQYSLLEFVAHLTSENYEQLPEDLAALGFLKKDKVDYVKRTGILEPLKFFLNQAGKGGGANAVRDRIFDEYRTKYPGLTDDELRIEMRSEMKQRVSEMVQKESVATGITVEVEDLQRKNQDSFQIPEWFLYSSRAFLTLEGVSLAANENYSLIKACFPYVAKRLVADDDPRARKALRELLYGASDSIDVNRITDLADGFTSYTTTTKTFNQQAPAHKGEIVLTSGDIERVSTAEERRLKMIEAEATMTLAKDSADVLLAPEGNLVQSLLVEESVLAASATFKDVVRNQFVDGPRLFRESLPFGIGSFLPELPFESKVEPFVRKTTNELKAQQLAEKIATIVQQSSSRKSTTTTASPTTSSTTGTNTNTREALQSVVDTLRSMEPEQAALVLKELRENFPRYAPLVGQLGGKFVSTLLTTASSNIDQTLLELEQEEATMSGSNNIQKQPQIDNELFVATVKSMSTAAQRGAEVIRSSTSYVTPTTTATIDPIKQQQQQQQRR